MMESGYPGDIFVEPIDDYLVCTVCNKVLRSPRATPCGHVFCHGCIETWLNEYGVCPQRCRELEPNSLTKAAHIEARISGLLVRCQNYNSGCIVHVPLSEKHKHEQICPYFDIVSLGKTALVRDPQPNATGVEEGGRDRSHSLVEKKDLVNFFKRTKLGLSFRTTVSPKPTATPPADSPQVSTPQGKMQSQRTYRLKRNRPKEPLGLVLVSGAKTSDGRHHSYYVKKVNRDSLGWKAGLKAGDTIIQVDNFDLSRLSPQESVARIKEKSVVTLTVLRDESLRNDEHIYDEILYADLSQNLSQPNLLQDENFPPTPPPMDFKFSPAPRRKYSMPILDDPSTRMPKPIRPISSSANCTYKTTGSQGEQTSKDSGLSSGSSGSPNPTSRQTEKVTVKPAAAPVPAVTAARNFDRDIRERHSYRTEREMIRSILKTQKRNSPAPQEPLSLSQSGKSRNYRIEGEYEVEEIYLEKNGTNQLGITLGYDSSDHGGCLYVCEVVAGGLAAADGRLRAGDIIRRVNGFEVYDPEEAILLFLEQDQDITLTVARKIKVPSQLQPNPRPDLSHLEAAVAGDSHLLRKVDSCGSLDSHTHHYATLEPGDTEREEEERRERLQVPEPRSRRAASQERVHLIQLEDPEYGERPKYRRGSSPIRNVSPLCNDFLSQQSMGSSPNLLRSSSRSPPSLSQPMSSIRHQPVVRPELSPQGRRQPQERRTSTTPNGKSRLLGGFLRNRRKISAPATTILKSPLEHESRIVVPPSPTQNFRGLGHDIRRLPNRFDNVLDHSANGHIRQESLV